MTDNTLIVAPGHQFEAGDLIHNERTGEILRVVQDNGATLSVIRGVENPDYEQAKELIREVCGEE